MTLLAAFRESVDAGAEREIAGVDGVVSFGSSGVIQDVLILKDLDVAGYYWNAGSTVVRDVARDVEGRVGIDIVIRDSDSMFGDGNEWDTNDHLEEDEERSEEDQRRKERLHGGEDDAKSLLLLGPMSMILGRLRGTYSVTTGLAEIYTVDKEI